MLQNHKTLSTLDFLSKDGSNNYDRIWFPVPYNSHTQHTPEVHFDEITILIHDYMTHPNLKIHHYVIHLVN